MLLALLGDGEHGAVCDGEVGKMEEWTCECTLERGRTRDAVEVTGVREGCKGCGGCGGGCSW